MGRTPHVLARGSSRTLCRPARRAQRHLGAKSGSVSGVERILMPRMDGSSTDRSQTHATGGFGSGPGRSGAPGSDPGGPVRSGGSCAIRAVSRRCRAGRGLARAVCP